MEITADQKKFLSKAVIDGMSYDSISRELGKDRKLLSLWWEALKEERERLAKLKQLWKRKCTALGFWDFERWYTQAIRICHYCKITEPELKLLIDQGQIHTKRLSTRGRTLEIERREPNKAYDNIDNLVLCCYWCNNAKTDEFSDQEFMAIGEAIAQIWKARLAKI